MIEVTTKGKEGSVKRKRTTAKRDSNSMQNYREALLDSLEAPLKVEDT